MTRSWENRAHPRHRGGAPDGQEGQDPQEAEADQIEGRRREGQV